MTPREIGGYLELEPSWGTHYHDGTVALNSGRGCILYLAELRGMRAVWVPDFMCDSVWDAFRRFGCELRYYRVGMDFRPVYDFKVGEGEWLFLCDYYGQLSDADFREALECSSGRLIVDETQAFYREPPVSCDVMYTCRKWFGVPDGGYVLTGDGARLGRELPRDESRDRMSFVLGRVERPAGEYFAAASENNVLFDSEPAKAMSSLTDRLMRGIDYARAAERRRANWHALHEVLGGLNKLRPIEPDVPFMYPLMVGGAGELRAFLISERVYVPRLWPNVSTAGFAGNDAVRLAEEVVSLPLDQRYDEVDMGRVCSVVLDFYKLDSGVNGGRDA